MSSSWIATAGGFDAGEDDGFCVSYICATSQFGFYITRVHVREVCSNCEVCDRGALVTREHSEGCEMDGTSGAREKKGLKRTSAVPVFFILPNGSKLAC